MSQIGIETETELETVTEKKKLRATNETEEESALID